MRRTWLIGSLLALLQVIDVGIRYPVVTSAVGVPLVHPAWPLLERQNTGLRPLNLPPARGVAAAAAAENVERGHSSCEWPSP